MAADKIDTHADLYLDLLKRALTNTIYAVEPDKNQENETRFVGEFIKHYIQGTAISMLPVGRLDNLQACMTKVINNKVPGDFIETGVWRGGATIFMRAVLKVLGVTDRIVWVADSFEGLPTPDMERFPLEAKIHSGPIMSKHYKHFEAGLAEVKANFAAYGMLDEQGKFLQGWFKDTLPTAPIESLSVLRLDGDYYESTWDSLVNLYDKLSVGGYVIIDDYGEDSWTYCRKAVDDFRRERLIVEPMTQVDSKCIYWQRSR